jgi:hypothetical protein
LKLALSVVSIVRFDQNEPIFKGDEALDLFLNLNRDDTPDAEPTRSVSARFLAPAFDCVELNVVHFGLVRQCEDVSSRQDRVDGP